MKKILLILTTIPFINGCALIRDLPLSSHNNNYIYAKLVEHEKPYSVQVGDESILVAPDVYMNDDYKLSRRDKFYRMEDGVLIEIKMEDSKKK